MLIPTIIMGVLAVVFIFLAYQKGGTPQLTVGLKGAGNMLLQMAPLLIFAMIIAGILPLLIPQEAISRWVGAESGWRGIFIGSCRWSYAGWTLRQFAHGGWTPAGRSRYRNHGSAANRMVVAGIYSVANGNRHNGLEIYLDSPCLHLFLPANSWIHS